MDDSRPAKKKRRRIKISHVLLALLVVIVAAFVFFRLSTKFKLRARIDAIYAAGYPVTGAELDQWYSIPPDVENAAYTIEEAFLFYKKWDKEKSGPLPVVGRAELPPRTEPLPPEMKALMTEYVTDHNEALELLHAGAAIKHCRYPVDLSAGFATLMPNLSEMRQGAFLLKIEALLHADNGDGAAAIRSAASGFGIARSLAGLPMTVAQLVRGAAQTVAVSAVEQVVNRTELTDEQLVQLIEHVREGEQICDISCAFVGERAMGLGVLKNPADVDPSVFGGGVPFRPVLMIYSALGMAESDAVIYLDLMDGYLKAAQLLPHQRQKAVDDVVAKLQSTPKIHILLHTFMPALSRVTTLDLRTIAHLRVCRVALAIQRYRLAADKLPDRLADLVPAYLETVPEDPFDGNELRYKKLEPGFAVYSIGEDLSDDDGKERPRRTKRGEKPPNWDVTFIVER